MKPDYDSRVLYGRLLGYVKPYWRMFALSIVALILTAATEPLLPALFKPLLDEGFVAKDPDFIRWVPVLLLALFIVRGITSFVSTYCMAWVGSRLVMDLRATMFDKLMTLPTRYFDQNPSGQLIAHLAFNVTQVTQSATSSLTTLVRDTVTVLGLLGYLLWLNWQLTTDLTLVSYGGSLAKALQAADLLAVDGIAAEVLDLRSLRPLDVPAVLASVARTHRAVIVDEGWRTGSLAAEVSARIMEGGFYELDAPVARVCSAEVPMPYAKHMEDAALPQPEAIATAAREVLSRRG